ncbi:MAG TPA: hypothetical protein VGN16_03365 [Acidobacteriaceae bacterium]|jgi:hypothetical protein
MIILSIGFIGCRSWLDPLSDDESEKQKQKAYPGNEELRDPHPYSLIGIRGLEKLWIIRREKHILCLDADDEQTDDNLPPNYLSFWHARSLCRVLQVV